MIVDHPEFVPPEDDEIKIWKYMDFTKLISLLETGCLFFSRADSFDDPFEGSYPRNNVEFRKSVLKELDEESKEHFLKVINNRKDTNKYWPRYTAISCWHMNEFESAAMWSLYLKSDEGIAIQSSYNKLKKSIIDDEEVYLGVVKYIDYNSYYIKDNNILTPFVHKRKSFEHESELRALMLKMPFSSGEIDFKKETIKKGGGVPIKVNIKELIDKIYVAPNAPIWFSELVDKTVKRYGYDIEVLPSDINNPPMF
jgi:hypothetical protein